MTAKRPSTARKHTRTTEAKRNEALDTGLSITVDGRVYTVRQGDLNSMDTLALRRETGLSFMGLLKAFQADPDIDLIAALMWLSRRVEGEQMLSYADVASEVGYDVDLDIVEPTSEETDPQA